jgi:hypothetical protein
MRKTLMLVGIPVAVVGVAIAVAVAKYGTGTKPNDRFAADLQQAQVAGLDLAQAQGATKYALTEIAPDSKPTPAKAVKQGSGTKAIRSKAPTVKAAPEPVAAQVVEDVPETQVTQTAADPTPAEVTAPAVPRPVPQTTQSSGADQGPILAGGTGRGTGRTGTDGGTGWGGIFGAIIRGGVVDGDNCDPRSTRGASRPPMRSPVYSGNQGGMVGARMPTMPSAPIGGMRRR